MDEQEVLARFDSVEELTEEQGDAMEEMREFFKSTARVVMELCPEGRARKITLTKLEDASHYAIKAITHGA